MSINYNEDAGETAGTMELDIEFSNIYNKSLIGQIKNSITSQDVEGTSFFSIHRWTLPIRMVV